jgi:4-amino-4-deoxy-L-arabinose transferase-like glycosyltransferase
MDQKARRGQKTLLLGILVAALFLGMFLLLLVTNAQKPLDHDEHQFVASGALLAREGLLPYRDYAYFHTPNLVFVYGALFAVTADPLLVARIFSTLCGSLVVLLTSVVAFQVFRKQHILLRLLVAVGAAILLLTNPLFSYTTGKAWNHDLPVLLTMIAFLLVGRGARQTNGRWWVFFSGLLVGLAAGTRLSFALAAVPFAGMIALYPGSTAPRKRWVLPLWFGLGLLLALLPSLVLFAMAPRQFLFGNLGYARYNTLYRQAAGFHQGDVSVIAMSLGGKFQYLARYVVSSPGNLLLLLAWILFAVLLAVPRLRRQPPHGFETALSLALFPFLLMGSLAPTPAFFQYFYALVPFLLLGTLYGMASLYGQDGSHSWIPALFALVVVFAGAYGIKNYESVGEAFAPEEWLTSEVRSTGVEIGELAGQGRVLTLSPIFPLAGDARIYPEFATGAFAWRVAPFVPAEDRQARDVVSADELESVLDSDPPAAILTGSEETLEEPFILYAQENGYQAIDLPDGMQLWRPAP